MLKTAKEAIIALQSTTKRTEKEMILKANKDVLKPILTFLLDPQIRTGLAHKKIQKEVPTYVGETPINPTLELMEYLKINNTGTDEVVSRVKFLAAATGEPELALELATKTLKTGVDAKTLNKVWGKTINVFEVQLAKKFEEHYHKIKGKEFILTEKLDGIRCILIKKGDSINFFSREGNELPDLLQLTAQIKKVEGDFVLDGELLAIEQPGESVNQRFRRTMTLAKTKGEKECLEFNVFDHLTVVEFENQTCDRSTTLRKQKAKELVFALPLFKYVEPLYQGTDLTVIQPILDEVEKNGSEGLMLNLAEAPYQFKRTDFLLKLKTMQSCDLRVIRVEQSIEQPNQVGSLICMYKGNELGVGSGLNLAQRESWLLNPELIVGKIIEISFFEETKNEKGTLSLRFPVLKTIRFDKTEESYN